MCTWSWFSFVQFSIYRYHQNVLVSVSQLSLLRQQRLVAPAVLVSLPRLQLNEQPLQHLIILVRQERRPQRLQHHWPTVSLLHHLQEDSVSDNRPSLLPLTRVDRILVGSTNISTTPESTPFTNIDDPLVPGSDNNTFCFTFVWCCYGYQCCTT